MAAARRLAATLLNSKESGLRSRLNIGAKSALWPNQALHLTAGGRPISGEWRLHGAYGW